MISATARQQLLLFFEQPLFLASIGIVGGLVGLFFYTPVLVICGACVLLAFHRAGVVSGKPQTAQICVYAILLLITTASLYGIRSVIKKHAPDLEKDVAHAVLQALSEQKKMESREPGSSNQPKAKAPATSLPKIPATTIIQTGASYGNLAVRCEELGSAIILFADRRNKEHPDPTTHREEYKEWFRRNDGLFRWQFFRQAAGIHHEMSDLHIDDPRLDELIERHEQDFESRQTHVQAAIDYPEMFYLSIDEIREIGERFKSLATQVPH